MEAIVYGIEACSKLLMILLFLAVLSGLVHRDMCYLDVSLCSAFRSLMLRRA